MVNNVCEMSKNAQFKMGQGGRVGGGEGALQKCFDNMCKALKL